MPDSGGININDGLQKLIRSNSSALDAHLECVTKDFKIDGTKTILHGHFIIVDTNNHNRMHRLAEAMRRRITDYAIPRHQFKEAQLKDLETGTGENVTYLHEEAKKLFTDLTKSGEGGELLLFMLAENFLGLPQILCKMSLKTDSRDHFKGSDGVYLKFDEITSDVLLYWGESKIYGDIQSSIRECLKSLSPFLIQPEKHDSERENDLFLLTNAVNIENPDLLNALKNYLDKHHPQNRKLKYCGIALAGFSHDCYKDLKTEDAVKEITQIIKNEITDWVTRVKGRIDEEKLQKYEIHFFCIALPDADEFRATFQEIMGIEIKEDETK
ncbi:MAG TPA: DUF1837 domain-containing protein [Verrucomicrobiae bacterium]|nr:DUF1837 domain-containing protein [Verrucomicrobiae bacterium]